LEGIESRGDKVEVKEKHLEDLKKKITSYASGEEDWPLVEKAYHFALQSHSDQKRESGESYIMHPLGVARILAELELDYITIAGGLLHDVVEDTPVTVEEVREEFGDEVALLVDGVTKLSRFQFKSKEEQQAETLRKMFLAMARDIRVILIKLADRTHNMRTLGHLNTRKQKEIARETLDIYTPLAHRLGIYKIKGELEDEAFRYLQHDEYYRLAEKLDKKRREREDFINETIRLLEQRLEEANIPAEIHGRPKNLYSIYTKMQEQNKDLSEIYDLTAIRVLVDSVKDCYGALGVVHTMWKPIPGRFKDYIAMPKPNMYQSLHTTVVGAKNELVEVQIRTWEMHRTAEYGIAAHWRYKQKTKNEQEFEEKLSWLRQLLEWQQDYRDAHEFMENLKIDLFTDEVFVFTPKGDVIDLPQGSIPLDFAYRIHTDIGNQCTGARVNGRLVPLNYTLKTGDIVEIITSKQGSPSRDWLKMVKTSTAKNRIRNWFKKERKEENIERGKYILEKELKRMNIDSSTLLKEDFLKAVGTRFNLQSVDDVYAAVGYGGVSSQQVIGRLREEYRKVYGEEKDVQMPPKARPVPRKERDKKGVRVHGLDNLLVRFARCCNPVPGDDIVGLITRGRGISVHRKDCPNLNQEPNLAQRMLEVSWEESGDSYYPVDIEVTAMDRTNLLSEVIFSISENRVNISAVKGRTDKNNMAIINLTLVVKDAAHLNYVMNKVKKIDDVYTVRRYIPG